MEKLKFKKKLKVKKFLAALSLHKLHFHVHYEEVYEYKRFQKFSIKTLTRIGCPNVKIEKKTSQSNLGVRNSRKSMH